MASADMDWTHLVRQLQRATTVLQLDTRLALEPPLVSGEALLSLPLSLAAVRGGAIPGRPTAPPSPTLSVGIVRLCAYDAAVTAMTAVSARNCLLYAKRHGYAAVMEGKSLDASRPTAWSKVRLVSTQCTH